jgi:hypothetical protein
LRRILDCPAKPGNDTSETQLLANLLAHAGDRPPSQNRHEVSAEFR